MSGSYVGARIDNLVKSQWDLFNKIIPLVGAKVPPHELHTTVLYSRIGVQKELITSMIESIVVPLSVRVIGAEIFDCWTEEGTVDQTKGTFVLTLESDLLQSMHRAMLDLGAVHDYPSYQPHVTLFYGVPMDIAKHAATQLNSLLEQDPIIVKITEFYYEPLNEDWVSGNLETREAA